MVIARRPGAALVLCAALLALLVTGQRSVAGDLEVKAEPGALGSALAQAAPGDVLTLAPGIHRGPISIRRGVTIRAKPGAEVRLRAAEQVVIESTSPVRLEGLTIRSEAAPDPKAAQPCLIARRCKGLQLEACVLVCGNRGGIRLEACNVARLQTLTIRGGGHGTGISLAGNRLWLDAGTVKGFTRGVEIREGEGVAVTACLLLRNVEGLHVADGTVLVEANTLAGRGGTGIYVAGGVAQVLANTARGHRIGITATSPAVGLVDGNTCSGNQIGIAAGSYAVRFRGNTVTYSQKAGFLVRVPAIVRPEKGEQVLIEGNRVSSNGEVGIGVMETHPVRIRGNLLEDNGHGVELRQSQAVLESNTIVLNENAGVHVAPGSYAELRLNILSHNEQGLRRSQYAHVVTDRNVFFANVMQSGSNLVDANTAKQAWMRLSNGAHDVLVGVMPARELLSKTDAQVDPGYIKLGTDYRLRPDGAAARAFPRELGAFGRAASPEGR